ncbi:anti-sigma factor [Dysgonomonas mossii]|uniref:anti-sigma factor n=1 Tax=Dysgonomonas mossii TaxID=163665 RepID=UPI0039925A48
MDDLICKYFSGELTEKERQEILIYISQNPDLKEEFIETQNLRGITEFLPRKQDTSIAEKKLSEFVEYTQNTRN